LRLSADADPLAEVETPRMDRLVLSARLKPGARIRAAALVAEGPPFDPEGSGFERHGVYLSEDSVVFVFEGTDAEYLVQHIVNDPVRSARFSAWGPLLDGRPTIARESWFWSRDRGERR
jgi:hypothetical protein